MERQGTWSTWLPSMVPTRWLWSEKDWGWKCGCLTSCSYCSKPRCVVENDIHTDHNLSFKVEDEDASEVEIDLDELLDIEDDNKRRLFIKVCHLKKYHCWYLFQGIVEGFKIEHRNGRCRYCQSKLILKFSPFQKFIEELLEKARTLWSPWRQ